MSRLGTTRSARPPLDGCSNKCDNATIAAFDSRTRATTSSTLSCTMYSAPSTSVMTVSGVASMRSIRSGLSAKAGPLRRVTVIIDRSLPVRGRGRERGNPLRPRTHSIDRSPPELSDPWPRKPPAGLAYRVSMRVLLVGAGGVGSAIAHAANDSDVLERVVVTDLDGRRSGRAIDGLDERRFSAQALDVSDAVA